MHIKKILTQHRRDFRALYKCDHCGSEREGTGYDDDHFHRNVVPSMACSACGMRGTTKRPMGAKYAADEVV